MKDISNFKDHPPLARSDVILMDCGAESVLYDGLHKKVHSLNRTALAIWQCCDGETCVSEIAEKLADGFSEPVDKGTLVKHVDIALAAFRENGLLKNGCNK